MHQTDDARPYTSNGIVKPGHCLPACPPFSPVSLSVCLLRSVRLSFRLKRMCPLHTHAHRPTALFVVCCVYGMHISQSVDQSHAPSLHPATPPPLRQFLFSTQAFHSISQASIHPSTIHPSRH
mmetsp:Transcript_22190/g.54609  ORF Transcript_22190/g.54609 Transcript_22190/m.54609 type:complete len:123 (-) Transcript_22190:377-745(-)